MDLFFGTLNLLISHTLYRIFIDLNSCICFHAQVRGGDVMSRCGSASGHSSSDAGLAGVNLGNSNTLPEQWLLPEAWNIEKRQMFDVNSTFVHHLNQSLFILVETKLEYLYFCSNRTGKLTFKTKSSS